MKHTVKDQGDERCLLQLLTFGLAPILKIRMRHNINIMMKVNFDFKKYQISLELKSVKIYSVCFLRQNSVNLPISVKMPKQNVYIVAC